MYGLDVGGGLYPFGRHWCSSISALGQSARLSAVLATRWLHKQPSGPWLFRPDPTFLLMPRSGAVDEPSPRYAKFVASYVIDFGPDWRLVLLRPMYPRHNLFGPFRPWARSLGGVRAQHVGVRLSHYQIQ